MRCLCRNASAEARLVKSSVTASASSIDRQAGRMRVRASDVHRHSISVMKVEPWEVHRSSGSMVMARTELKGPS